jgi:formate dehydrogenase major subunit
VPAQRLSAEPGLTVVEVVHAIHRGHVKGLYVMGENPAMSDPDTTQTRQALSELELLVVQDIFLTETAMLADVVLPASSFAEKTGSFTNTDRTVQLARQVLQPPGQARQDLWILLQMAQRLGLDVAPYGEGDAAVAALFDEMRRNMPNLAGINWQQLQREGSAVYPCRTEGEPPEVVEFQHCFATADGRAHFVPATSQPADELPDADYPLVLITGRQLEHWHTGSMSRRSAVLDALEPDPVASLHPRDMAALGLQPGELVTLRSRRGQVCLYARADDHVSPGAVFVAFCYYEAAINRLTNPALDPVARIPEFKYCAIRAEPGGAMPVQTSLGGGQAAR